MVIITRFHHKFQQKKSHVHYMLMDWKCKHITNCHINFNIIETFRPITFTYFKFDNLQDPTTSLITTLSSTSYGCINRTSSTCSTTTSTLIQNLGIFKPWNLSMNPQWPLILPNATFCLGFLGFTNTTYCPIFNCNPPNNSSYFQSNYHSDLKNYC